MEAQGASFSCPASFDEASFDSFDDCVSLSVCAGFLSALLSGVLL